MLKTVSTLTNALGALNYKGTWNANTNTPTLQSGVGTKGDYYVVSQAGSTNLDGITDWQVGDWAVFNGSIWQKIDNTDAVVSVNGQTGVVVLTANDVGATPNTSYVIAGTGLSGGGQLTGNVTISNSGVTEFNTRTGNVTLSSSDVTTALGYTPGTSNTNGTVTNVATGTGLSGGPITTTGTISLANTAVTPGTYGSASEVSQVTVDAQGRITSASNVIISISTANVTGLGTMAVQDANNVNITGGSMNVTAVNSVATTVNTVTFATSSLPLIPEGYITINLNGVAKKIPYYGV